MNVKIISLKIDKNHRESFEGSLEINDKIYEVSGDFDVTVEDPMDNKSDVWINKVTMSIIDNSGMKLSLTAKELNEVEDVVIDKLNDDICNTDTFSYINSKRNYDRS